MKLFTSNLILLLTIILVQSCVVAEPEQLDAIEDSAVSKKGARVNSLQLTDGEFLFEENGIRQRVTIDNTDNSVTHSSETYCDDPLARCAASIATIQNTSIVNIEVTLDDGNFIFFTISGLTVTDPRQPSTPSELEFILSRDGEELEYDGVIYTRVEAAAPREVEVRDPPIVVERGR